MHALQRPFLLLLIIATISLDLQAQRIAGYVSAGAAVSQVEGDELKGFDKWGLAGGVGALVNLSDNGTWKMSLEADYARRGAFDNRNNPYNLLLPLDYVDIPLTVFYRDPIGGLLIGVGPVYSRLVQQPHGSIGYNKYYFIPDTSDMAFLKNDLALAAELRFTIWRGLQFSARYQRSLIPVKRGWMFQEFVNQRLYRWENDCYNSSITIRLIWQFGELEEHHKSSKRSRRK